MIIILLYFAVFLRRKIEFPFFVFVAMLLRYFLAIHFSYLNLLNAYLALVSFYLKICCTFSAFKHFQFSKFFVMSRV